MHRSTVVALLVVSLSALACAYKYHIPSGDGVYGIDISHYNPVTNWTQLIHNPKFPLRFIFTKATEGKDYIDGTLVDYWKHMNSHPHIVSGLYHFYRSDHTVEENLANINKNVFEAIPFNRTKNLFAIDFETNYSKRNQTLMAHDLHEFLVKFEQAHHFKPFIYGGAMFWAENVGEAGESYEFHNYPLWVSHYGPEKPNIATPWQNYTIWQYTSIEKLPGIVGSVDMDWWPNPPHSLFGDIHHQQEE